MTVVRKFFLGLGVIALIAISIGIYIYQILQNFDNQVKSYQEQYIPTLLHIEGIQAAGSSIISASNELAFLVLNYNLNPDQPSELTEPASLSATANTMQFSKEFTEIIEEEEEEIAEAIEITNRLLKSLKDLHPVPYSGIGAEIVKVEMAKIELVKESKMLIDLLLSGNTDSKTLLDAKEEFEDCEDALRETLNNIRTITLATLETEKNRVLNNDEQARSALKSAGAFILFTIILLAVVFRRWISKPLEKINAGVLAVNQGNYNQPILIDNLDEFGKLSTAFNQMTGEIGHLLESRNKTLAEEKKRADELKQANQQLQETQKSLIQSSRLASIGELAAGVGHELNNPLFVIITATGQMRRLGESVDNFSYKRIEPLLKMIDGHCTRMEKIINHLRNFARKSDENLTKININDVIHSSFTLLNQQLLLRNIQLKTELSNSTLYVLGDANSLEQVLINLLNNARDALENASNSANSEKIITVSSKTIKEEILITVEDNGPGIPEDIMEKIFDAFYTTKEVGKGTGLGLSISHHIITEQHKGKLDCQSTEGDGTVFSIRLKKCTADD